MTKILYPQALLFYNSDSFRLIHTRCIVNKDYKMTFKFIHFSKPTLFGKKYAQTHIRQLSEKTPLRPLFLLKILSHRPGPMGGD